MKKKIQISLEKEKLKFCPLISLNVSELEDTADQKLKLKFYKLYTDGIHGLPGPWLEKGEGLKGPPIENQNRDFGGSGSKKYFFKQLCEP